MKKYYYKSDFDFVLRLKDEVGKNVPWPECDWEAIFWTHCKSKTYTASCNGGEYTNCYADEAGIHFVFDGHNLGPGALKWEVHFELPNDIYYDGIQDIVNKQRLEIELVSEHGFDDSTASISALLPLVQAPKGGAVTPPNDPYRVPVKHRYATIKARPGFVYKFNGIIKLGMPKYYQDENTGELLLDNKYDLSNIWVGNQHLGIRPLADCITEIRHGGFEQDNYCEYTIQDNILAVEIHHEHPMFILVKVFSNEDEASHVAICRDELGRIIFNPIDNYPDYRIKLSNTQMDNFVKKFSSILHKGEKFIKIQGYKMQIRSCKRHKTRWRGFMSGKVIRKKATGYFIRACKVNRNGDRSDWVYYSLKRATKDDVWVIRQLWV